MSEKQKKKKKFIKPIKKEPVKFEPKTTEYFQDFHDQSIDLEK